MYIAHCSIMFEMLRCSLRVYEHYFQATHAPHHLRCIRYAPFQIPTRTAAVQADVALHFLTCPWHMPGCASNYVACPSCRFPALYSAMFYPRAPHSRSCLQRLRNKQYMLTTTLNIKGFQQILCIRQHVRQSIFVVSRELYILELSMFRDMQTVLVQQQHYAAITWCCLLCSTPVM
jgi:hypothetical protein